MDPHPKPVAAKYLDTSIKMATQADKDFAAKQALRYFYAASTGYSNSFTNELSFETFAKYIQDLPPGTNFKHLGGGILVSEINQTQIKTAMEKLAAAYRGRLPDARGARDFLGALSNEALSVSYALKVGIVEGAKDVIDKAATVAKMGLATYILFGAGAFAFVIYSRGKR